MYDMFLLFSILLCVMSIVPISLQQQMSNNFMPERHNVKDTGGLSGDLGGLGGGMGSAFGNSILGPAGGMASAIIAGGVSSGVGSALGSMSSIGNSDSTRGIDSFNINNANPNYNTVSYRYAPGYAPGYAPSYGQRYGQGQSQEQVQVLHIHNHVT